MASASDRADNLYLDAIEAQEAKNIEGALSLAEKALKAYPDHIDSLWLNALLLMPKNPQQSPDLPTAAKALSLCRRIISLDSSKREVWQLGGRLLTYELGMYEEGLVWWQNRRELTPTDPEPIIEQIAILADLGLNREALDQFQRLLEPGIETLLPSQQTRLRKLHTMVAKTLKKDPAKNFVPWKPDHPSWELIRIRSNRKPASETFNFMLLFGSAFLLEMSLFQDMGQSTGSLILSILVITITFIFIVRISRNFTRWVNQPAFDLLRAMDVELSSGKVIIPEEMRGQRLYKALQNQLSEPSRVRLESIVEEGRPLPKRWKPKLPDLSSVDDEVEQFMRDDEDADDGVEMESISGNTEEE